MKKGKSQSKDQKLINKQFTYNKKNVILINQPLYYLNNSIRIPRPKLNTLGYQIMTVVGPTHKKTLSNVVEELPCGLFEGTPENWAQAIINGKVTLEQIKASVNDQRRRSFLPLKLGHAKNQDEAVALKGIDSARFVDEIERALEILKSTKQK